MRLALAVAAMLLASCTTSPEVTAKTEPSKTDRLCQAALDATFLQGLWLRERLHGEALTETILALPRPEEERETAVLEAVPEAETDEVYLGLGKLSDDLFALAGERCRRRVMVRVPVRG